MHSEPPARATNRGRGGDPPNGGLIPEGVDADGASTKGLERQCAARAAAPQSRLPTTRGAMNYSIRNLVIAGGLAIAAIAAVLIYTSNVQQAAKQGHMIAQYNLSLSYLLGQGVPKNLVSLSNGIGARQKLVIQMVNWQWDGFIMAEEG